MARTDRLEFMVGIGIVGTGVGARNHARDLRDPSGGIPGAALVAVCGRDPGRTEAFAREFGCGGVPLRWATSLDQMLAMPGLDAVIIASQDDNHGAHATAALCENKHLLVEKPMFSKPTDAEAFVSARVGFPPGRSEQERIEASNRRRKLVIAVGYHLRHHAAHRLVRDLIHAGTIGRPIRATCSWATNSMGPNGWRAGTQNGPWALAAIGTHLFDLAYWILASEGETVRAKWHGGMFDDKGNVVSATAHLPFCDGSSLDATVSVVDSPVRFARFEGPKGTIECRGTFSGTGMGDVALNGVPISYQPVNPYAEQLADFARAIVYGTPPAATTGDGLRGVYWLDELSRQIKRQ